VVPEGRPVPSPGRAAGAAAGAAAGTALVPASAAVGAGGAVGGDGNASTPNDDVDEAPDITTNFFEERRLLEVVRAQRHRPAAQIRDAILRAVAQHTAGIPQSDDITLIVVKRVAAG
jgi:hypothetical protein